MGTKTSFGKWSPKERDAGVRKTNRAIKKGIIPPPSDFSCTMCGRGKDQVYRMEYHHKNYDTPTENLVPLCSGCHSKMHRQLRLQGKDDTVNCSSESAGA